MTVQIMIPVLSMSISIMIAVLTIKHKDRIKQKEINKEIIEKQSKFKVVKNNGKNILFTKEIYLVCFKNSQYIMDNDSLCFEYEDNILNNDNWGSYKVILKNVGFTTISSVVLHSCYKSYINFYYYFPQKIDYFNDHIIIKGLVEHGECIELVFHYPKNNFDTSSGNLDYYIHDENGKTWVQEYLTGFISSPDRICRNDSKLCCPNEYHKLLNDKVYENLYCNKYYWNQINTHGQTPKSLKEFKVDERNMRRKEEKYEKLYYDYHNKFKEGKFKDYKRR